MQAIERRTAITKDKNTSARAFVATEEGLFDTELEYAEEAAVYAAYTRAFKADKCVLCPESECRSHRTIDCKTFGLLPIIARKKLIMALSMCFICGSVKHMAGACKAPPCNSCGRGHHTRLHVDSERKEEEVHANARPEKGKVALMTTPILIRNPITKAQTWVNALLDSGNSTPLLAQRTASNLGLTGYTQSLIVHGIGGTKNKYDTALVSQIEILGESGSVIKRADVRVINQPTGELRAFDWSTERENYGILSDLELKKPVSDGRIDLIIGCSTPDLLGFSEERTSKDGRIGVRKTPFGWLAYGCTNNGNSDYDGTPALVSVLAFKAFTQACEPWKPEARLDIARSYRIDGSGGWPFEPKLGAVTNTESLGAPDGATGVPPSVGGGGPAPDSLICLEQGPVSPPLVDPGCSDWPPLLLTDSGEEWVSFLSEEQLLENLHEIIQKSWEIENPGEELDLSPEEQEAIKIMTESKSKVNGRHQVSCLWRPGCPSLKNNASFALARLRGLDDCKRFTIERRTEYDAVLDS